MQQLTEFQASAMYASGVWWAWSDEEVVKFQLFQKRLCVGFTRFHAALEQVLGRSVWVHELGNSTDEIRAEYLGLRPAPSFAEILALIPADKLLMVIAP